MNMAKQSAFYDDIMADAGSVATVAPSAAKAVSKETAFFANKRGGAAQVIGIGDTMVFADVGARHRGIRPWERERMLANERREKDRAYHAQRKWADTHRSFSTPQPQQQQQQATVKLPKIPMPVPPPTPERVRPTPVKLIDLTVVDAWDD